MPECGSHAKYLAHRSRGEDCAKCREGERVRGAERRKKKRVEAVKAVADEQQLLVDQLVRAGVEPVPVVVPGGFNAVDSALWEMARIRAAMEVALPRDVAPLAKAHAEVVDRLNSLTGEGSNRLSMADELRAWRESRRSG